MASSTKPLRILVSAGDPSGDLMLAKVVEELKKAYPHAEFLGLCGEACQKAGVKKIADSRDVAVVGITEVLFNLRKIFSTLHLLGSHLDKVDLLICVDFPDFNLKLAEMAYKKKVPVDYLVAPQVWAWRSERLLKIKKLVRKLYVILPFEENYFKDRGVNAEFLGHPIRDLLPPKNRRGAREEFAISETDFVLTWMPGSRASEIKVQLPLMLDAFEWLKKYADRFYLSKKPKDWKVLVAVAPGWDLERINQALPFKARQKLKAALDQGFCSLVFDSRKALMSSDFAWITSGTATLEAALYQLPHILVYKLSGLSVRLIRASSHYFADPDASAGLPNILLERKIIPEILQGDLTPTRLAIETGELLGNQNALAFMRKPLRFLPKLLGEVGACARIAQDIGTRL